MSFVISFFFILIQKFKEVNFPLQVVDLPSTVGSVFFELLQTALPEGMSMTVHEHKEEHEEVRYVPDVQLLELKSQLEDLGRPSKKK
jgi:large subunit ribosomal protein L48